MVGHRYRIFAALVGGLAGAGLLLAQDRPAPRSTVPVGSRSSLFFGRGFDLDQGPDFALSLDGIPLNLPSALRAPGFFDDGILIPETVEGLLYHKGSYRSDQGPFAIAGSAAMEPVRAFDRPLLKAVYGGAISDRFGRLLWAESRSAGGTTVSYALEGSHSSRPWNELEASSKVNAFVRILPREPGQGWNFTLLATEEKGDGGSPPLDAPLAPSFPGDDDPRVADGYHFQRVLLGLNRDFQRDGSVTDHVQLYGGASSLRNWATSTYFLVDNYWGDQVEQVDRRVFLGGEAWRQWQVAGGQDWTHRLGLEARLDQVGAADLYPTYQRGLALNGQRPIHEGRGTLVRGALCGQSTVRWGEGWHGFVAARVDSLRNHVYGPSPLLAQNRSATLVSPRLGLGYSPWDGTEVRAAWGQGLRPGNAFRDTRTLIRAHSAELGVQTRVLGPWESSVTFWALDLEAEAVFAPEQSALVLGGPSRRQGLEWFNAVKWGPWRAEAALAWSRVRFRELPAGLDRVPGAIPQTGHLKVGWTLAPLAVSLKFRSLGAYALKPDNSAVAGRQNLLDLRLERTWKDWTAAVEVSNAFNLRKNGRVYYYESRPPDEPSAFGSHSKSADPQAIRVELCCHF